MNHWIRSASFVALALLAFHMGPLAAAPGAKPMAVWIYADWCTNCKMLAPKYAPARAGLEDKIEFVTLDVTNDQTRAKARDLARSLGISALYYANNATGWVALLNPAHVKVGEILADESTEQMHAALAKLASGAPVAIAAPALTAH